MPPGPNWGIYNTTSEPKAQGTQKKKGTGTLYEPEDWNLLLHGQQTVFWKGQGDCSMIPQQCGRVHKICKDHTN